MSKIYALQKVDGSVAIMRLVDSDDVYAEILKMPEEYAQNFVSVREITEDKIPTDRTFRNAWTDKYSTETIDVDIDRAKEIQKDKWREARKPLLEKLDQVYMRTIEEGDPEKTASVVAQKKQLRDCTKHDLSQIGDPAVLAETWPEALNGPY